MDIKLNSLKMEDGNENKPTFPDSLTASQSPVIPGNSTADQAGCSDEVTSCLEQISTTDVKSSSPDVSVNVSPNKTIEVSDEANLHDNPQGQVSEAVSICSPSSVERDQPKPLCALLSSTPESCRVCEVDQPYASRSKSPKHLKTTIPEPDCDDLCAAILLACLFCHPLDCLLATMRGCNQCVWSLCSYLCGCQPTTLQPLLDVPSHCDLLGCLGVRCCLCDCPLCDICMQATECLELAMEVSQMLYH